MKETEVTLNGEKIKVITKLPKEEIEDNNIKKYLDNTVDLEEIIKEIKKDD